MTLARTAMTGTAALCAAVLVLTAAALPPAPRSLSPSAWRPDGAVTAGVFHVHTLRSDGTGTVDEVAAAAARAGLNFVIFTDHGDATRQPDAPAYRSGVLCIDAVEISTTGGHYAGLGLGRAPYPLGGDPRDVVEDVARLGGFGVVTHPDSAKGALAWRAWNSPFEGLEWLNADSEWRDEPLLRLGAAFLTYPIRGAETVASLFHRPVTLARWDKADLLRRVVGLAGSDAHARVGWKNQGDPYEDRTLLKVPSYEATFRAFSLRVTLDRSFSGRAGEDAHRLLGAIRAGHVHTLIDAFARPGLFEFTGHAGSNVVREGDAAPPGDDVLVLRVRTNAPPGSRLVLFRDGKEVNRVTSSELVYATNHPGAYRAEAWLGGIGDRPMPWAVSNPIFVGPAYSSTAQPPGAMAPRGDSLTAAENARVAAAMEAGQGWHVEHDAQSSAASRPGDALLLDYRLGQGTGRSQFAALARDGGLPAAAEALAFRGVAGAPMRVSVQLRVPRGSEGERWERSVYLDATPREIEVPFAEMRPAGETSSSAPRVAAVGSILFVVDRTHARAGSAGWFRIERVRALKSLR